MLKYARLRRRYRKLTEKEQLIEWFKTLKMVFDMPKKKKKRANNLPNARKADAVVHRDEAHQRPRVSVPSDDVSRGQEGTDKK